MSIKDLIKSAFEKDAVSFEETFASIIAEKLEASIAAKYDSMFESKDEEYEDEMEDDEDDDEEYEDEMEDDEDDDEEDGEDEDDEDEDDLDESILNELSPDTLKRYMVKSRADKQRRSELARAADARIADRKVYHPFGEKDKIKRDAKDSKSSERNWRKTYNREVGQERATSSLEKGAKQDLANLSPEEFKKKYKMNKTDWKNKKRNY